MIENMVSTIVYCSKHIKETSLIDPQIVKSRVIYNFIKIEHFLSKKSLHENMYKLLFVGRIDENKGLLELLKTMRNLPLTYTLSIVGAPKSSNSQYYIDCLNNIVALRIAGYQVNFLNEKTQQEMPRIYKSHDLVCCLSQQQEAYGMVAVEAILSGCAVIGSKLGGLEEAIPDQKFLITEYWNSEKIAQEIKRIVEMQDLDIRISDCSAILQERHLFYMNFSQYQTLIQ
ncbi:glycosyltransferase family 4 protein [Planktomarina temperata]|nr:glycosyltransferase family 4 protein [Planktomarina temperata]